MKRALTLVLVATLLVAGCAAPTPPFVPRVPLLEQVDARLLQRCDLLPDNVIIGSVEQLLQQKGEDAAQYNVCATRQDALATLIEQLKIDEVNLLRQPEPSKKP